MSSVFQKEQMLNETKTEATTKVSDSIKKEDFEHVTETITYVKLWLILFVLIVTKVILIKAVKLCRKIYTVHNERVIRQHTETNSQA